jgi:hypothetical protein
MIADNAFYVLWRRTGTIDWMFYTQERSWAKVLGAWNYGIESEFIDKHTTNTKIEE